MSKWCGRPAANRCAKRVRVLPARGACTRQARRRVRRARRAPGDPLHCEAMPVFRLDDCLVFPPVHLAEDGLLALGGDLRPERLLLGYTQGIFPWYAENLPILWHSPDPRMVMTTRDLNVQRSLRKAIKRKPYELTVDKAFRDVLTSCAQVPRPGQTGTWLIPEMVEAYM